MDKKTTIAEAFELYCRAKILAARMAEKTHESYLNTKKLVLAFLGSDTQVRALSTETIRDFHFHLLSWQKQDTARGNLLNLRCVIKYCARKGIKTADVSDIETPRRKKKEANYLTEAEFHQFVQEVGRKRRGYAKVNRARNVAICELLYATGLRVGELCRLNRDSIKDRQFTIVGKSKNPRIGFITAQVEHLISDYLKLRDDCNPAMFVSNQNGRRITPGGIQRVFRFVCERSDFVGVHPHTIRHSCATKLLEREVDIRYIAELMGHESLDTTRRYTHFANPKLHRIYDAAHTRENNKHIDETDIVC